MMNLEKGYKRNRINKAILTSFTFFIIIILVFTKCNSVDNKFLLPNSYKISLECKEKYGITTFYVYNVNFSSRDLDSISQYPKKSDLNQSDNKWHKPNDKEKQSFREFYELELKGHKLADTIIDGVDKNLYYIFVSSYSGNPVLGENGYSPYDWQNYYFLNLKNKELIYLSYGEF